MRPRTGNDRKCLNRVLGAGKFAAKAGKRPKVLQTNTGRSSFEAGLRPRLGQRPKVLKTSTERRSLNASLRPRLRNARKCLKQVLGSRQQREKAKLEDSRRISRSFWNSPGAFKLSGIVQELSGVFSSSVSGSRPARGRKC